MTIGPYGTILVADQRNNRVIVLDSELTTGRVLLKHDRLHSQKEPQRMCYVPQKQLYVIGQWKRRSHGMFFIFALNKNRGFDCNTAYISRTSQTYYIM